MIASLIPVLALVGFFEGWRFLLNLTGTVATALLAEFLAGALFHRKATLYDGSSILMALLFFLILPPALPLWMISAGCFFCIFIGKELFGGSGDYPFHPAVLGYALLYLFSPAQMTSSSRIIPFLPLILVFGLSGLFLIGQRRIYWEIPLIYLISFTGVSFFFRPGIGIFLPKEVFLAALFLITDYATTPVIRRGKQLFALACAFLAALLYFKNAEAPSIYFPILWLNALSPWIDSWVKPQTLKNFAKRRSLVFLTGNEPEQT
jgi:Na+-translocating ferredoxin:NAD+ oxidoreductase RnfD subunit